MLRGTFTSPLSRKMANSSFKRNEPLVPKRECIIVPRQVLEGLLTALHIQLSHPSCLQLKAVTKRYLYALDMDINCDSSLSPLHRLMPNTESARGAVVLPSTQCRWRIFHRRCYQALKSARAGTTGMCDLVHSHDPAEGQAPPHSMRRSYPPLYPNASARWTDSRHTC